jgi:hypothetical protein
MDFKGQFPVKTGKMCWPLTLMDLQTRYLLRCHGLGGYRYKDARPVLLAAFQELGLPQVIRSDNGSPFASRGPGGLSAMAVWFIRLGIRPERIAPGCPTQNGAHERMHRTLKAEATKPASETMSAQQRRFARFIRDYNEQRPHEALKMTPPADHTNPSERAYPRRLRVGEYPSDWDTAVVYDSGQAPLRGRKVYVGRSLAEQRIGFKQQDQHIWQVWFLEWCVGTIDCRTAGILRPQPLDRIVTHVPGSSTTPSPM